MGKSWEVGELSPFTLFSLLSQFPLNSSFQQHTVSLETAMRSDKPPTHVAFIMDGNGRWAKQRELPRTEGHKHGKEVAEEVVRSCHSHEIEICTLFAFSTENWRRPDSEVQALMALMEEFVAETSTDLNEANIRFEAVGRIAKLPDPLPELVAELEETTSQNEGMLLQVAVNYGGRADIVEATRQIARQTTEHELTPDDIDANTFTQHLATDRPDPDLLIRTGGEKRLSNFMLWQLAYTELVFIDTLWPDFTGEQLAAILEEYEKRDRRFGDVD